MEIQRLTSNSLTSNHMAQMWLLNVKRMGTRLRNLKKTKVYGKDGKLLKWGGKGRVTNGSIDQIAQYYGNAIRSHTNDLEGMYEAC